MCEGAGQCFAFRATVRVRSAPYTPGACSWVGVPAGRTSATAKKDTFFVFVFAIVFVFVAARILAPATPPPPIAAHCTLVRASAHRTPPLPAPTATS